MPKKRTYNIPGVTVYGRGKKKVADTKYKRDKVKYDSLLDQYDTDLGAYNEAMGPYSDSLFLHNRSIDYGRSLADNAATGIYNEHEQSRNPDTGLDSWGNTAEENRARLEEDKEYYRKALVSPQKTGKDPRFGTVFNVLNKKNEGDYHTNYKNYVDKNLWDDQEQEVRFYEKQLNDPNNKGKERIPISGMGYATRYDLNKYLKLVKTMKPHKNIDPTGLLVNEELPSIPMYDKPTNRPVKPIKPTAPNQPVYDDSYENLSVQGLWPSDVANARDRGESYEDVQIGYRNKFKQNPFTYGEAQKFPEEIQNKIGIPAVRDRINKRGGGTMAHKRTYKNEIDYDMLWPDYDSYGSGGWLSENLGNIASTVGGGILTATGLGSGIGIPMMAKGAMGMIGSAMGGQNEEEMLPEYQGQKQGLYNQGNIAPMRCGGRIKKHRGGGGAIRGGGYAEQEDMLTEYSGPLHDSTQGGIPLGEHTMVEGGENRTKDIIHSDLPITKDIVREFGKGYGGSVPITMGDAKMKRSVADKIRIEDRAFDKYYGDRWNEASRKMMHIPFEQMSDMLGMRRESEYNDYNEYQGGGEITSNQAREIGRSGYKEFPTEDVGEIANYLGNKEYGPYSHLQFDSPNSGVYQDLDRISKTGDKAGLDKYITELQEPLSNAPVYYNDLLEQRSFSKRPNTKMLKKKQGGGKLRQLADLYKERIILPAGRGIRAGAEEIAGGIRDIGYDIREQFPALDRSSVYPGMPTPEDELRYTGRVSPKLNPVYPGKKSGAKKGKGRTMEAIIGAKQGGGRASFKSRVTDPLFGGNPNPNYGALSTRYSNTQPGRASFDMPETDSGPYPTNFINSPYGNISDGFMANPNMGTPELDNQNLPVESALSAPSAAAARPGTVSNEVSPGSMPQARGLSPLLTSDVAGIGTGEFGSPGDFQLDDMYGGDNYGVTDDQQEYNPYLSNVNMDSATLNTSGGGNDQSGNRSGNVLGYAPLIGEALNIGRTMMMKNKRKPIKYPRVPYKPYNPKTVSPTEALSESNRGFRSTMGQLKALNPRAFLNRATQMSTAAGRQGAGIRQQYDNINAQTRDRADMTNTRNKLYADMRNAEIGRMEQIDTQKDEAMLDSASGMHISNLFTQAGQVGRDMRLEDADERKNERWFNHLAEMRKLHT